MKKEEIKVSYAPLWKLLAEREIKKSELREITGIAASTFTKMTKNEMVSLGVLARISLMLDCKLDDIVSITKR